MRTWESAGSPGGQADLKLDRFPAASKQSTPRKCPVAPGVRETGTERGLPSLGVRAVLTRRGFCVHKSGCDSAGASRHPPRS